MTARYRSKIVEHLNKILLLYSNKLDANNERDLRAVSFMADTLAEFGDKGVQACEVYLRSTNSFFSWGDLLSILSNLLVDYPEPEQAWHQVTQWIRDNEEPHPLVKQTVMGLGGIDYLKRSDNLVSDRSNFYRLYDDIVKRKKSCAIQKRKSL